MKHRRKLRCRKLFGARKEAAGEDLECQVPRRDGKVDVGQEGFRVEVIEAVVDAGNGHRCQWGGRFGVDPYQILEPEGRTPHCEHQSIPRR